MSKYVYIKELYQEKQSLKDKLSELNYINSIGRIDDDLIDINKNIVLIMRRIYEIDVKIHEFVKSSLLENNGG